ncbi:MAG: hypothetical protein PHP98_09755 [Kiritimatiellae bacterium]|nr:hypothetical protein [Kiritimatiellia bacterium]
MTGRERVLAAVDRRSVDRYPYDLAGTDCSGIHVVAYQKLRDFLGLPKKAVECGCLAQLVAKIDDDVKDALQVDAEALYFGSKETKIWQAPFQTS